MAKKGRAQEKKSGPSLIQNRKAYYEFNILDDYEAGIALVGSEVKSIWKGRVHIKDAYCRVKNREIWLYNLDVEPYEHSSHFAPDRMRDRKLLLQRKQIDTIERKVNEKGLTIVPLKIYFSARGRVKVLIGIAQGKKLYDKRSQIAERESKREEDRARSMKY